MNATKKTINTAWYALRRTLPIWSFDENFVELKKRLKPYHVDELIVKIDSEEFTHGHPPLEWAKNYQKKLFQIKALLDSQGIVYSLNPWVTLGHNDRGRDLKKIIPNVETMVGHDGTKAKASACPLSIAWQHHVKKLWKLYAQTQPSVIWIEDDIRTFNHKPVDYSCFCPKHLHMLSKRAGEHITRSQLVKAILQPGKPHPLRKIYLDIQNEITNKTISFLSKTVHSVSPQTSIGLMSSDPRFHCLEGRNWGELAKQARNGGSFYSRPPLGNYNEESIRGLYYSQDSIKLTRACLPSDTVEQTEIENIPFTLYSKSLNVTFLQMVISFAYGCQGVTLNLFDHCGTPMEKEKAFGGLLKNKKKYLSALTKKFKPLGLYRGVQLLHHDKSSYHKSLSKGSDFPDLSEEGYKAMLLLENAGIPTTYEKEKVVIANGQSIMPFTNKQIMEWLGKGKGLFLDAIATRFLCERGFGEELGIRSMKKPVHLDELGEFAAEEYYNPEFGGRDKKYLTLIMPRLDKRPYFSVIEPDKRSKIISEIVTNKNTRKYPCMMAFENKLGGRVVIQAYDLERTYGPSINSTHRREQLHEMIKWLSFGNSPLLINGDGVYPLGLRKDLKNKILLGFINLSLDNWNNVEFNLGKTPSIKKFKVLNQKGEWDLSLEAKRLKSKKIHGHTHVTYSGPLPFNKPLFIELMI